MTIDELFKTRQSIYYKNMSKYLKYVMNDHFVILLLFLGGATGLAYQNYLESIQSNAVLPRVLLLFLIILAIFSGSIRTLVEPADAVFLLPKEKAFSNVMLKHLSYSFLFHSFFTLVIGVLAAPLLRAIGHMRSEETLFWLVTLVFWKLIHLLHAYFALKQHKHEMIKRIRIMIVSMMLLGMIASLFLSVRIGFFLAAVIFLLFLPFVLKISQSDSWNWELLIESEQRRVQKIYSLINLFIETPYSKHKVKRLRILDVLYQIPALKQNTEIYYLSRMFVRNSNFSGLFLRLVLIGSIVIYFSENGLINSLISVLFLYLIGFQLIPLRETFKKTIYFRLYPDTDADKIKPTQKLIMLLLAVSTIVYGLASISSGNLTVARLVLLNSLFSMFFVYVYLPRRLRK